MIALVLVSTLAAQPITLEEVREAARNNLEAVRATLEAEKAIEGVRVARSAIYPQISTSAQLGAIYQGPQRIFSAVPTAMGTFEQRVVDVPANSRGNFQLGLQLQQLIYDGGKWWNQIRQSGAQLEAAKGQQAEQQLASELEAVRRFYVLLRAQASIEVIGSQVKRSEEQVSRAQALYEAGRAQKSAAIDAQVNLGNDRISWLNQQQSVLVSQVELLSWLGRATDQEVVAVDPGQAPNVPVVTVEAAVAEAKQKRPLIRALQEQLKAQQLATDIAWSGYLPRVSGQVGYSRSSPTPDPFFTDPTRQNAISLGLGLQWDIFNGFVTDAQVQLSRIEERQVEAQNAQTLRELEGEIRRAVAALTTQLEVEVLANTNLELSKQGLSLAEQRFTAGAGSNLEVRDAQLKVTQSQLTQVQARLDVAVARAALRRLVGSGS